MEEILNNPLLLSRLIQEALDQDKLVILYPNQGEGDAEFPASEIEVVVELSTKVIATIRV